MIQYKYNNNTFSLSFLVQETPFAMECCLFFLAEAATETGAETTVLDFNISEVPSDSTDDSGDEVFVLARVSETILPSMISLFVINGLIDGRDPRIGSRMSKYLHAA